MNLPQFFQLDGRTAFISAARGHLGAVMTRALAGAGAHVIVNGRDDAKLALFEEQLRAEGFSIERAAFDIADMAASRAFFASRKRLDIMVNNAVSMQVKGFSVLEPADFAVTYESAVTAAFEAVRAALPALKQAAAVTGEASIVNIASMYGQVAPDGRLYAARESQSPFHYGPAKAALLQLTRHLAAELGPHGIRVNTLVPGAFPARIDPGLARQAVGAHHAGPAGRRRRNRGPASVSGVAGFQLHDRRRAQH